MKTPLIDLPILLFDSLQTVHRRGIVFTFAMVTALVIACPHSVAQQAGPAGVADGQPSAGSWQQFRGNLGDGTAPQSARPPINWTEQSYKWRTELPGRGWSSPVYADGRIWVTSAIDTRASEEEIKRKLEGVDFPQIKTAASSIEFHALCIDLESGSLLHDIVLGKSIDTKPINPMNSYASPTAAISGGMVVCHFGNYGTWCLDAKTGKVQWTKSLVVDHSVGPGSSPVIVDDLVIVVCDGTDQQYITALDLKTGAEVWKTFRPPITAENGEFQKAYSTPVLTELNGQRQLVIPGAQWIAGYDPRDGTELWRTDYGPGYSVTPMVIHVGETLVFCTGYDLNEFVGIRVSGLGEQSAESILWRTRSAPAMSSPVRSGDLIYSVNDEGVLVCLDATTGEYRNRKRALPKVSASPLLANGHLYFFSRDGAGMVIRCDPEMEIVTELDMGSPVYASPAPVGNDLLIRTQKEIIRISDSK